MNKADTHLKIFEDFQHFLHEIWTCDKDRDWKVSSTESFRRFWDIHIPEVRKK